MKFVFLPDQLMTPFPPERIRAARHALVAALYRADKTKDPRCLVLAAELALAHLGVAAEDDILDEIKSRGGDHVNHILCPKCGENLTSQIKGTTGGLACEKCRSFYPLTT